MTQVYYAGIGSAYTPDAIAKQIEMIASILAARGFVLRTGLLKRAYDAINADSAELAFARGCDAVHGAKVQRVHSYLPDALNNAATYHAGWADLQLDDRRFMTRYSLIMLGDTFDEPVSFLIHYGADEQALRIANRHAIPTFDLAQADAQGRLWAWLAQ